MSHFNLLVFPFKSEGNVVIFYAFYNPTIFNICYIEKLKRNRNKIAKKVLI